VSWRVFKNPVALYIGGIAAVLLELAEPRVRTGVWEHTTFRTDPLARLRRTGLAAMVTVYGARSQAETMIAGITRRHARVAGTTPDGREYHALQPELMDWVQVTATYGFLQAYHRFVSPLSPQDRDRFYAEALPAARLYGAPGAPGSEAEQAALFERMFPLLEAHPIVREFLDIMRRTHGLPLVLRPLEGIYLRAAVTLLPAAVRDLLEFGAAWNLRRWQRAVVAYSARMFDRIPLRNTPPVQACLRLGLPANYLFRRPDRRH
jgi:uncharacterized protein (DUF2236 family)